jgi:hypothetical protein
MSHVRDAAGFPDCGIDVGPRAPRHELVVQHRRRHREIAIPPLAARRDREQGMLRENCGPFRVARAATPRTRPRGRAVVTRTNRKWIGCHVQREDEE